MDIKEIIAEMFLKDYQATWDGEAENWSLGSLSNFDFHQFGVKQETGGSGQTNSGSNFLDYCQKLPDSNSNRSGAIYDHLDFASNRYRDTEDQVL